MRYLIYISASLMVLSVILLLSCSVYDDYEGCYSGKLLFSYKADGDMNVIEHYIDGARLFIFDANDKNIFQCSVKKEELTSSDGFRFPYLESGNYHVVVWGNMGDNTLAESVSHLTTFSVHSKKNEEGRLETNDPLYLGTVDILITDEHPTTAVVPFFSAHIDIQVSCLYFETIYGTEVTPLVQIENSGSRYLSNQEGIPVASENGLYSLPVFYKADKKEYNAFLHAFRFEDENNVFITISHPHTSEVLKKIRLKEYLQGSTPALFVNGRQEVRVLIQVEFTGIGIVVRPPVWKEGEITPGL